MKKECSRHTRQGVSLEVTAWATLSPSTGNVLNTWGTALSHPNQVQKDLHGMSVALMDIGYLADELTAMAKEAKEANGHPQAKSCRQLREAATVCTRQALPVKTPEGTDPLLSWVYSLS